MAIPHCFSTNGFQASRSSPREFEHKQTIQHAQGQAGAPTHLTRALYLPMHTHNTSHLPIYDISERYFETLGPLPLGGRKYKIEFCLLLKPCGYDPEDDVRFLVDMGSSGRPAAIQERCLRRQALDATMQVLSHESSSEAKGISLAIQSPAARTWIGARLLDTKSAEPTKNGSKCCPSLEFSLKASGSKDPTIYRSLKWQPHLNDPGSLRYNLIDLEQNSPDAENGSIVAIYHHCGFEEDLHASFSEGVVLLPRVQDPVLDITIVSSLLYLLHVVRKQDIGVKKSRTKSILRKFVR
ncbi:hypothetical protein CEP53_002195 [Fusarium sp. AF-6]|nr:hypothetical protein CEP53_002195 [Fusarium sp. AF-6]